MVKCFYGVVCVLCFAVLGCGKAEFKEFTSKEGRFSVQMPGTPKQENKSEKAITLHNFAVEQRNGAFVVSYADLPPPGGYDYEAGLQGIMSRMPQSTLRNKGTWQLGDAQGITYELDVVKPAPGYATGRLIVVGGRLYQLLALGSSYKADNPDVKTFVESFKIIK